MRTILFAIILFFSFSVVKGQKIFNNNQLDSIIKIKGELNTIHYLMSIKFSDTLQSNQIWYSASAILDEETILSKNYFKKDTLFNSNEIKLYYWIWLIYESKINFSRDIARLTTNCSSENLFDCKTIVESKLAYVGKKYNEVWIKQIKNSFEMWLSLVDKKGIGYVRRKKISPLNDTFKFIIIH